MQDAYVPAPDGVFSLHSKLAADCGDVKVKLADVWFVAPLGPLVIDVSGGSGVAVGVGVGVGVDAASTTTEPVICECAEHTNE